MEPYQRNRRSKEESNGNLRTGKYSKNKNLSGQGQQQNGKDRGKSQ